MRHRGWRQTKWLLLLVALVALVLPGAARGVGSETKTLRVGVSGTFDEATAGDIAAFAVLQRKTGIKAEFKYLATPQAAIVAATRGDVDLAITGLQSTVEAIRQGARLRMLMTARHVNEWMFVANVPNLASLKGKRVGYHSPGTETQAFSTVLVKRAGLKSSDVQLTAILGSPNRAAALLNGTIDGTWLNYLDYVRVVRQKPSLHALLAGRDLVGFSALQGFTVTEDFLKANRPLLRKVVSGLLDGYEDLYQRAGRQRFMAYAGESTTLENDADAAAKVYGHYRRIGFWPRRAKPVTYLQWQNRTAFWQDEGIVQSIPPFEHVWDLSFWHAAAKAAAKTKQKPKR